MAPRTRPRTRCRRRYSCRLLAAHPTGQHGGLPQPGTRCPGLEGRPRDPVAHEDHPDVESFRPQQCHGVEQGVEALVVDQGAHGPHPETFLWKSSRSQACAGSGGRRAARHPRHSAPPSPARAAPRAGRGPRSVSRGHHHWSAAVSSWSSLARSRAYCSLAAPAARSPAEQASRVTSSCPRTSYTHGSPSVRADGLGHQGIAVVRRRVQHGGPEVTTAIVSVCATICCSRSTGGAGGTAVGQHAPVAHAVHHVDSAGEGRPPSPGTRSGDHLDLDALREQRPQDRVGADRAPRGVR